MARRLGILGLFAATALLAVSAYWLLFTAFMAYDDEGYVLVSLLNYARHGGLYAHVYSQYGPFFYVFHDALHRVLGYDFTNTTGRWFTLACWLLAAGAAARVVWRQTRDAALAIVALGATFFHLWLMISEPIHPGGLIAALVAAAATVGAGQIERRRFGGLAVTAGLAGAALLLTKANVGGFFLMAAGAWFAANLRPAGPARALGLLAAALVVVLPVALMRTQLREDWGWHFTAMSTVASLGMLGVAWRERQPFTTWRDAGLGAAALGALGLAVVAVVGLRGTSATELLEGVLLWPLRHPGVYHFAPVWLAGTPLGGVVSLGLAAWYFRSGTGTRFTWLLVALRVAIIFTYVLAGFEWLPFTTHSLTMSFAVPFAWIFAVRLAPADQAGPAPGVLPWLGLLLVLQYLHAYPVAGSQVAWGTFLIAPVIALGLHDTRGFLAGRGRAAAGVALRLAVLAAVLGVNGRLAAIGWARYRDSRPLGLAGAETLRLPENYAGTLRTMTLNATAHGDLLFTLPGMNSFHLWTQLPEPTLANTTHWFTLLTPAQQAAVAAALDRSERPVLIVQHGLLHFLDDNGFSSVSPLETYLLGHFARAFSVDQYEFWVRRGRTIAALGTVEQFQPASPVAGQPTAKLELVVPVPAGAVVHRIELSTLDAHPQVIAQWDAASAPLAATGIDLAGTARIPAAPGWDCPLPPVVRLSLSLDRILAVNRSNTVAYVRGADGALLAEARFTD